MDVTVDRDRCEGTGFCVRLATEHFELDDQGIARFRAGGGELNLELAEEVEALCPTNAIRVGQATS